MFMEMCTLCCLNCKHSDFLPSAPTFHSVLFRIQMPTVLLPRLQFLNLFYCTDLFCPSCLYFPLKQTVLVQLGCENKRLYSVVTICMEAGCTIPSFKEIQYWC